MSAHELNRLLQEGLVTETGWEAIAELDESFVARFDLTDEELTALREPNPQLLASIDVHPLLAMWGTMMRVPEFAKSMSVREYFEDFQTPREGQSHG